MSFNSIGLNMLYAHTVKALHKKLALNYRFQIEHNYFFNLQFSSIPVQSHDWITYLWFKHANSSNLMNP